MIWKNSKPTIEMIAYTFGLLYITTICLLSNFIFTILSDIYLLDIETIRAYSTIVKCFTDHSQPVFSYAAIYLSLVKLDE